MSLKYLFVGILFWSSWATADDSSVYLCGLRDNPSELVVRLKKYFDVNEKMDLGKVDRLHNADVLESSDTKVYQIPIIDRDYYVQLWYGHEVSVDAQLAFDQGHRAFSAIYKKKSERLNLICYELYD